MNHCLLIVKIKNYHRQKKGWPKGVMKWRKKQTPDLCIHIMVKILHLHYIGNYYWEENINCFFIMLFM